MRRRRVPWHVAQIERAAAPCEATPCCRPSSLLPPPKSCPSAVGCLYPEHIYLLSATIKDGTLYVFSVDAFPENWRAGAQTIKRLRSSFAVGAPEENEGTGAGAEAEATVTVT